MHQKILFLPLIEIEKNCADSRKIQGIAVNIGIKKNSGQYPKYLKEQCNSNNKKYYKQKNY